MKKFILTIAVLAITSPLCAQTTTISGSKGSNVSAPSTTKNVPVLPAIACGSTGEAVTSGRVVFPCTDLFSSSNVIIRNADGTAATLLADPISATTTAATECVILSTASTNANSCLAQAGNFYGFELYNTTTTVYYLRLYNLSTSPTCSSATGFIRSIPVPPGSAAGQVGGAVRVSLVPKAYSTGLGYCLTAGSASTDNNAAAAGIFGVLIAK